MQRKNTVFILVVILVAIASFILGASMNMNFNIFIQGGSTTTTVYPTITPQELQELTRYTPETKEAPIEYSLNQLFVFDTWELRVSNIWIGDVVKHTIALTTDYLLPLKNRKFLAIEIVIKNIGDSTSNDAVLDAQIITSANEKYGLLSTTYYLDCPKTDNIKNLTLIPIDFKQYKLGIPKMDSGTTIKRYLFFTIPKDQTPTKLLLRLRTMTLKGIVDYKAVIKLETNTRQ